MHRSLTVFGATGNIGHQLVRQALAAGDEVTAVVRDPGRLDPDLRADPKLRIATIDLSDPDPDELADAVAGADAVLSGLGPRRKSERGIVTPGTRAIAAAASKAGVRRLLVVSGVGVSTAPTPSRPNPPRREPGAGPLMQYFTTPVARWVLGKHFVDVAVMEDFLSGCDLDWTVMRVPYITARPPKGYYRTTYGHTMRASLTIARADAAEFMLRLIGQPHSVGKIVTVAY